MKKFKLKVPRYTFDHKGMIIRGKLRDCEHMVDVHAGDLCDDNMDIMSKENIRKCMIKGDDFTWRYELDELEFLEPIKLTRLDYETLKFVQKQGAKYICRDESGDLNLFENEPYIINKCSSWYAKGQWDFSNYFTNQLFQSIKWEDEKYYIIEDVLENCEIVED